MRWPLTILGTLLNILGILWILQGLGIIDGSSMSGQSLWVAAGVVSLVAGMVVTYMASRNRVRR
jgi:hypothetical protein